MSSSDWNNVRTLEEIRRDRGESPHCWLLMAYGALPQDSQKARAIAARAVEAVETALGELEKEFPGDLEVTGFSLRVETFEAYRKAGMPGVS